MKFSAAARRLLLVTQIASFQVNLGRAFVASSCSRSSPQSILFPPVQRTHFHQSALQMAKAGVSSPDEIRSFVENAGDRLLVVDVRNPDATVEPGDQKSLAVAPLPDDSTRPRAQHIIYDRSTESMELPEVPKDTPIITHCGGGGRGQKAKDYLNAQGFTNVINGGGPKETDCWKEFGSK